ncbi:hypothetical protein TNCV_2636331 [Trichonephila clavipes]|uniref:Uncharacterized protein n=1 Tax=Trichonephila clavipes TaxID=2585209 RepID=A0A8X6R239_TRICX|nr:hypothetical protein TNCV_2636331 [Trichonephila clavipes]
MKGKQSLKGKNRRNVDEIPKFFKGTIYFIEHTFNKHSEQCPRQHLLLISSRQNVSDAPFRYAGPFLKLGQSHYRPLNRFWLKFRRNVESTFTLPYEPSVKTISVNTPSTITREAINTSLAVNVVFLPLWEP